MRVTAQPPGKICGWNWSPPKRFTGRFKPYPCRKLSTQRRKGAKAQSFSKSPQGWHICSNQNQSIFELPFRSDIEADGINAQAQRRSAAKPQSKPTP
jgi:hypothetical protein